MIIAHNWDELRRFMWDYVGIVRAPTNACSAPRQSGAPAAQFTSTSSIFQSKASRDLTELRKSAQVAELMIESVTLRPRMAALHYT